MLRKNAMALRREKCAVVHHSRPIRAVSTNRPINAIEFVMDSNAATLSSLRIDLPHDSLPRRSFAFGHQIEVEDVVTRLYFARKLRILVVACGHALWARHPSRVLQD